MIDCSLRLQNATYLYHQANFQVLVNE